MRRFLLLILLVIPSSVEPSSQPGRVVYVRDYGKRWMLHMMNADGTKDRRIPGQIDNVNTFPTWSPDGRRIAFQAGPWVPNNHFRLCVINADGTGRQELALPKSDGAEYTYAAVPAWSPNGEQITFHCGNASARDVFVSDADGAHVRKLNPPETSGDHSFWLPDGKRVAYRQRKGPVWRLVACQADGTGEEELVPPDQGRTFTADVAGVSPDGMRLLYAVSPELSLRLRSLTDLTERLIPLNEPNPSRLLKKSASYHPVWFRLAAWAPDGKSFLMSLPTRRGIGIFRVSENGKQKTRLTPDDADCFLGHWTAR